MRLFLEYSLDAISLGVLDAILALGVGLIFGIMNLVNFAHGAFIMGAGYTLLAVVTFPWPLALLTVVAVTAALAITVERVAFRPLRRADGSTLLITSFTVAYFLQSLVIAVEGAGPRAVAVWPWTTEFVSIGTIDIAKLDILMLGGGALLIVLLWLFLTRTRTGLAMRAAAVDFQMLRLVGGRADRVIATAFAISGMLAAVAGLFLVAKTSIIDPAFGVNPVLVGFVATVIGGMGSLVGAALGGFLIGVLTTVLQATLPTNVANYRDALLFAIVIGLLVIRPSGLLGGRATAERLV